MTSLMLVIHIHQHIAIYQLLELLFQEKEQRSVLQFDKIISFVHYILHSAVKFLLLSGRGTLSS